MAWVRCCGGTKKEKFTLTYVSSRSSAILNNNVITDSIPQGYLTSNEHLNLITFTASDNFILTLSRFVSSFVDPKFRVYDQNNTLVFSRDPNSPGSYNGTPGTYSVYLWNTDPRDNAYWNGNIEYVVT